MKRQNYPTPINIFNQMQNLWKYPERLIDYTHKIIGYNNVFVNYSTQLTDKHSISANKSVFKRGNKALPSLIKPPFFKFGKYVLFFPL